MVFIFLLQAKYHLTNQVICLVLKFKTFLEVLGRFSTFCYNVAKNIPPTMYKAMKIQKNYVNFKRFVSCKMIALKAVVVISEVNTVITVPLEGKNVMPCC